MAEDPGAMGGGDGLEQAAAEWKCSQVGRAGWDRGSIDGRSGRPPIVIHAVDRNEEIFEHRAILALGFLHLGYFFTMEIFSSEPQPECKNLSRPADAKIGGKKRRGKCRGEKSLDQRGAGDENLRNHHNH